MFMKFHLNLQLKLLKPAIYVLFKIIVKYILLATMFYKQCLWNFKSKGEGYEYTYDNILIYII